MIIKLIKSIFLGESMIETILKRDHLYIIGIDQYEELKENE